MPFSEQPEEGKMLMTQMILKNPKRKILDVGAGAGKWGKILSGKVEQIDCVEIWKPYIEQYRLKKIYNRVYNMDIMDFSSLSYYDVVILGDVLEHLHYKDAIKLVKRLKKSVEETYLTIPVSLCIQGEYMGNPYETHRYQWTHEELEELGFDLIHKGANASGSVVIGTYVMRGKNE